MSDIITPSILSGFMELLPEEQVLFDRIKDTIEEEFQWYGFWPLDTPAIEKSEILFAKGGGETTKQIYKIDKGNSSQDQALRFDLTVPLARYVAQHSQDLAFPFRRYQIAKVYRGERSQKGRYREFYQCDIDIVGRNNLSLDNDAEIPSIIYNVFQKIGLSQVTIHINNRRLLNGFFLSLGINEATNVLRSIDKLDKLSHDQVKDLLFEEGLDENQVVEIFDFLDAGSSNEEILDKLEQWASKLENSATEGKDQFITGYQELKHVYTRMQDFGMPEEAIKINLAITRGLDYYTGTVYESFLDGYESIGSVCSGGRYDDLASNFTKEHLPGIGVSIGLTRLFYQLRTAGLMEPEKGDYIQAIVLPLSEDDKAYAVEVVNVLRQEAIPSLIYMETGKVKKKFSYADQVGARYAILVGESEREARKVSIKDLKTGEQKIADLSRVIKFLN